MGRRRLRRAPISRPTSAQNAWSIIKSVGVSRVNQCRCSENTDFSNPEVLVVLRWIVFDTFRNAGLRKEGKIRERGADFNLSLPGYCRNMAAPMKGTCNIIRGTVVIYTVIFLVSGSYMSFIVLSHVDK